MDTLWAAGGSDIITQGDCSSLGVPFGQVCVCVCGGGGGDGEHVSIHLTPKFCV